jgi:adenylate cyclase
VLVKPFRLELLGRFELCSAAGEAVNLSGKKIQALVAYLAVEGRRTHTRDRLAALLWGEMGDERSRHNLRQALSKIRRGCEELLVADGETIRLNDAICDVDTREFERSVRSGEIEELQRGLALYRHDLLEGFTLREDVFDDWLSEARRHLRQLACGAIERLVASLTEQDQLDEAMDLVRRRLAFDPACEEAHRYLMQFLNQSGRRSEALRQYELCVLALQRELGAQPASETTAVYESIRDGGSTSRPAPFTTTGVSETAAVEPPSIAVVPFESLSAEEHHHLADGIADDILTSLSRFGSLTVFARTSTEAYRERNVPPQQIGRELGAQFVLQGSVQRQGQRVRINLQLLETAEGTHVWAQRFDREIEDLFVMQDEVTATVVSTLAGRVEAARLARARRMPPDRLDAYDTLVRAKEHYHRHTPGDCEQAIRLFKQAIERDPDYAAAHAWLACGLGQAIGYRPAEMNALVDEAHDHAEKGRQLDDHNSECHRILAQVFMLRHDLERALSHQERALLLNPNDDRSACGMGEMLIYAGRHLEGEKWVLRAMRLNPYHPEAYWFHLGRALFHAGRDEDALAALGNITRPGTRELVFRAGACARLDDPPGLERALAALRTSEPDFDPRRFVDRLPYERDEDRAALLAALQAAGL